MVDGQVQAGLNTLSNDADDGASATLDINAQRASPRCVAAEIQYTRTLVSIRLGIAHVHGGILVIGADTCAPLNSNTAPPTSLHNRSSPAATQQHEFHLATAPSLGLTGRQVDPSIFVPPPPHPSHLPSNPSHYRIKYQSPPSKKMAATTVASASPARGASPLRARGGGAASPRGDDGAGSRGGEGRAGMYGGGTVPGAPRWGSLQGGWLL